MMGRKVFQTRARSRVVQPPVVRTSLLHGGAADVQQGQELLHLVVPTTGSLRNGTVVATEEGELLLRVEGRRSVEMRVAVESGVTFLEQVLELERGFVLIVEAANVFARVDVAFQLVETQDA